MLSKINLMNDGGLNTYQHSFVLWHVTEFWQVTQVPAHITPYLPPLPARSHNYYKHSDPSPIFHPDHISLITARLIQNMRHKLPWNCSLADLLPNVHRKTTSCRLLTAFQVADFFSVLMDFCGTNLC